MKITLSIIWTVIWVLLSEFLFMPSWSFSGSGWIYANLISYFGVLTAICWGTESDSDSPGPVSTISLIVAILSFGIVVLVGIFGSSAMFNSAEYQRLIGNIKETEFTSNIQPVAPNQMLIVDQEIARRIGEKVLGSDPGLGSRATLGNFTLQAVRGQLYWIAPLEHSGFWKWNAFSNQGTPGYVKVSAINQEDYALVKNVANRELRVKYQTGSYLGQDLERHVYRNGYRSKLFTEFTFEVDDEWNPYWTITLYDTKIGFDGDDAIGVLTVDPETGEIKEYSINKAPLWIDRIQPESFVSEQVDDWGSYVHGYWNWSHADVKKVAEESSLVLGSDGRSYFYFGLTSSGNDNSTVGFAMVDTRTKATHWFKQAGATEGAARGSAEGKVQEKGYVGSDGITYNIGGYPTYEFLLKDKAGLMKLVALVNVHDHTIVGVGENRHEAIQDYRSHTTNRGNSVSVNSSDMEKLVLISTMKRIASEIVRGNTFYYFILDKNPKLMFTAGVTISNELSLTQQNDKVKVSYIETGSGEISLLTFDNLTLGFEKDSIQVQNEHQLDSVRDKKIGEKSEQVIDSKWKNLSVEEKRKLMKK